MPSRHTRILGRYQPFTSDAGGLLNGGRTGAGYPWPVRLYDVHGTHKHGSLGSPFGFQSPHHALISITQYYSLAGGFSFAKITRVLELTSYLVDSRQKVDNDGLNGAGSRTAPPLPSASGGRRLERLVETSQWILAQGLGDWDAITPPQTYSDAVKAADASKSPTHLPGSGEAWMDTIKVRLLHAQIRARVMGRVASGAYDLEKDGVSHMPCKMIRSLIFLLQVPLNTEDLCATLAAFSVAPIWCLDIMGIPLSHHEREAYLALWRHLGFYLGVPARVLHSHFSTYERANAFFESAIAHLFSFDEDPATIARLPTVPVLRTVAARGGLSNARAAPKPHEFEEGYHFALAHALIGPELAVSVGLPPPSLRNRWRVRRKFWEMRLPIVFGRLYPRRAWEAKRLEIIRRAVPRMMIRLLGNRRSTFFAGPPAGVSPRAGDVRWIKIDANTLEWAQGGEWIMRAVAEQDKEMMSVIRGAMLFMTALLSGVAWKLMY
jgi:hypothetical protein